MTATIPTPATGTATSAAPVDIDHYIAGHIDARAAATRADVYNPATGQITGKVAMATTADVDAAVAAAAASFPAWSATPAHIRARILFRFRDLVERTQTGSPPSSPPSTAKCTPTPRVK